MCMVVGYRELTQWGDDSFAEPVSLHMQYFHNYTLHTAINHVNGVLEWWSQC